MRICIDLTSLADNFSGIERFAMSVAQELIKDKSLQFILLFKNEIHSNFIGKHDNVRKIILKGSNKLFFNQLVLPYNLLRLKADRYLFLAFPAPFLFFNSRSVSAIHDVSCWDCPTSNKQYMTLYFKILYKKAALGEKKIITVSEFSKGRIRSVLHKRADQICVAYNGLSEKLLDVQHDPDTEKEAIEKYALPDKYLLCLSTLEPRKNLRLLIEAFSELVLEDRISCELVLAGRKGWLIDDLMAGVDPKVKSKIVFTGFIEEEHLPYIYKNAEAFVFPSLYEGFGVPPIEAMCMRTPVISSDAASLPEVLGDAAEYFENNNKDDLKRSILKVINMDKSEKERMIEKGLKNIRKFSWEKSAEKIYRFIV